MEIQLGSMSARIEASSTRIEALSCRYRDSGVPLRFDTVMYLDELKGLHAIARSHFDAYRSAEGQQRTDLEPGLRAAWDELMTALGRRPPS